MAEQLPTPEEKIALIDLDGTLIDQTYDVTDPAVYEVIEETQAAGWLLGLSSDTAYEALTTWRQRFKMNGPLVAEKGAVIEYSAGQPIYSAADSLDCAAAYDRIREHCYANEHTVWEGNPVEALRLELSIGRPNDTVVLLNNQRKCSLSLFVRRVNAEGRLVIEQDLTEDVVNPLREHYPSFELDEDLNHDHGLLIIGRKDATKRAGTQRLQQIMGIGKLAMIGNSGADYIGQDIALHYGVSDSTPEFKARADYVANTALTSGVVEILRGLSSPDK